MVCPDLGDPKDHEKDFSILGEPASMISDKLIFQVRKCNNETLSVDEPRCEDEDKINEFVNGLMIESWILHEKIMFEDKYRTKPTYHVSDMKDMALVDPNRLQMRYLFLRSNTIESEEDWFQFGQSDDYNFYDVEVINQRNMHISYFDEMEDVKGAMY